MSTPKIAFYPLKSAADDAVLQFACRLAEKASHLGHRVHLLVAADAEAALLDDLLWSFRDTSFLPHRRLPSAEENPGADRVTLGTAAALPTDPEVLINLTNSLCEQHGIFADIREIVPADEAGRAQARQRYRYYQECGFEVETKSL